MAAPKPFYQRWWAILVFIVLVLILIWLIALVLTLYADPLVDENKQDPRTNPLTTDYDDDPHWGSQTALIKVVAFEDFTCLACGEAHQSLKNIREEYSDKIYFVYRDFPIISSGSTLAAMAAECADDQGKFWEMHDKLFENQQVISEEYSKLFASQIGLDINVFNTCLSSSTHRTEISNDLYEGYAAGASATPTFFINGVKFEGALTEEMWRQIIDEFY